MDDSPDGPDKYNAAACAEGWFRVFTNEHITLLKLDVPPTRDEHVNTLALRLTEVAGTAKGHLTLDLSAVEFYSWTWIRALIDLSVRCADLGGELRLQGVSAEGARLLKANKSMLSSGARHAHRGDSREGDFLPIGGRSSIATRTSDRTGRRTLRAA